MKILQQADGGVTVQHGHGIDIEPLSYQRASHEQRLFIDKLMQQIEPVGNRPVLLFGSGAQQQLADMSDRLLEGMRDNNLAATGQSLADMITVLHSLEADELDPEQGRGFFQRLWQRWFARQTPVARFVNRYDQVRRQIDTLTDRLEHDKTNLLRHILSLDKLYQSHIESFVDLDLHISAAQEQLRRVDEDRLPALQQQATASRSLVDDQALRDLHMARNDLEQRIHDLKLTRLVAMQGIPGIRIVQENDKQLVEKINSTIANTLPLWRQQIAHAVMLFRTAMQNRLAGQVNRQAQIITAQADTGPIHEANQVLVTSVEQGLEMVTLGQQQHLEAENGLRKQGQELRHTIQKPDTGNRRGDQDTI